MLLKRYILIFALALISCAGTKYIHANMANDIEVIETRENVSLPKDINTEDTNLLLQEEENVLIDSGQLL